MSGSLASRRSTGDFPKGAVTTGGLLAIVLPSVRSSTGRPQQRHSPRHARGVCRFGTVDLGPERALQSEVDRTDSPPPYVAYATTMGTFVGGVALTGVLAHRLRRQPPAWTALDLAVFGLATFKAARTIARDEVTSFIRAPFVEGTPPRVEDEKPVRTGGLRQAVGELLTCSRCVGTWAAAGIAAADVLAPRFGRMLGWSLALGGVNDWLQAGFTALTRAANRDPV